MPALILAVASLAVLPLKAECAPGSAETDGSCGAAVAPGTLGANTPPVAEVPVVGGGSALHFSADTHYVEFPYRPELNLTANFTLELWVNPSTISIQRGYAITNGPWATCGYAFGQYGGHLYFDLQGRVNNSTSAVYLTPGVWNHIAASFTPGSSTRFYVNGAPAQTMNFANLTGKPSAYGLRLGGCPGQYPLAWPGAIDEVRVWNVVRTPEQIAANWNRELTALQPGLVGYWRLNEGEGLTAWDRSDLGTSGTLNGPPGWIDGPPGLISHTSSFAITANEDTATTITLGGTDADGDPVTSASITQLPTIGLGALYQLAAPGPVPGARIDAPGTVVADPAMRVVFVPPPELANYSTVFRWSVSDGVAESTNPTTCTIRVLPVDDPPALVVNDPLVLSHSTEAVISAAHLSTTDVDTLRGGLVYTITQPPEHGTLWWPGMFDSPPLDLTQLMIDAGGLTYLYTGQESPATDSFSFTVTDGTSTIGPFTFQIQVLPFRNGWTAF